MDIVFSILAAISLLAGIVGCVLPIIPGPPLAYLSLILVSIGLGWDTFTPTLLIVMGVATAVITVMDYVLPSIISKKHGASKAGTWGSLIGMIAGMILFPPFGLFIGAFAGAVLGELIVMKRGAESVQAGWGVFVGIILAIGIKLGFAGLIGFLLIKAVL